MLSMTPAISIETFNNVSPSTIVNLRNMAHTRLDGCCDSPRTVSRRSSNSTGRVPTQRFLNIFRILAFRYYSLKMEHAQRRAAQSLQFIIADMVGTGNISIFAVLYGCL